jgi:hypothetical protein
VTRLLVAAVAGAILVVVLLGGHTLDMAVAVGLTILELTNY